ncbi:MFS transporter [Aureimonas endophytica]|uniref:MFS transporter n=1 Tax=Aureimonas endophytica TaxID=2027858 RepID=A0A916ZNS6_9HYPH|nr:RsmB/NOP family class I SAM-dependent RNA methyltransferase [Aureimonas endophytica]GGE06669.1 MFS transporter [Aureimonas endophytica]
MSAASKKGARRPAPAPAAPDRPGLAARLVAARLLGAVVETRTSLDGLTDPKGGHPGFRALEPRDQGLVKAILLSALRHRGTLERVLAERLEHPLPEGARSLRHLLHVAAAQILFLDVPDSAAVDLGVAAADGDPRNRRFKGLVNALLRRLAREKAAIAPLAGETLPGWLRERLVASYGVPATEAIALAHLAPAPIDLTVKSDPEGWAARLGGRALPTGTVRLAALDGPLTDLPGFAEGEWWVQDAAAALPARLFGPLRGRRALDLCAAPGGKTAQLAEAGAAVTALDQSETRMRRLRDNLTRLGLQAETLVADAASFAPDAPFDAVLLDAPCSSTGTIRRHPDVAFTKDAAEVEKLARVQARLLAHAAKLVAPGGTLVFSNCSLDPAEGEAVVEAFLAEEPDFHLDPVRPEELPGLGEAIDAQGRLRTLPSMLADPEPRLSGLDGFFAARLIRRG